MKRSWKVLTFSSVSTAANEVRGEKRRRGTWGTGRTKLSSVLQGSGLNTGLVHTRQTLSHLDICGGLVPDIALTWSWSPQTLNPYCQLAQRLLQPRHAVCLYTSNHSKSPFSTISVRPMLAMVLFLKYFQSAAGWIWGYRTQRLWRLTDCMCFSGDVSPRENSAPGRTEETVEVPSFLGILLVSMATFYF